MSIKNNLATAEIFYRNGEFDLAINACQKILDKKPNLFNALQIQAISYQGIGELNLALKTFKRLIEVNDKHATSYNNIGNIYLAKEDHKEAIKYYCKAQKLDAQMSEVSNNLAICQQNVGQFDKAEGNYKKAIMLDGSKVEYHYNLGVLYSDLGYFDASSNILLKTLELDRNKSQVYWHVVKNFMYQHRYQDALEVADMGLVSKTLSDKQFCELLVAKAMLLWLFYNPLELDQALTLSNHIYNYENDSDNMNNMIVFHRYIKSLLHVRESHPSLYKHDSLSNKKPMEPLYFISESHGFSSNEMFINYKEQEYAVNSLFIMGAKVIHFISDVDNRYKASLSLLLDGLPAKSKVVMGFGEIDCRINEGIFIHCTKTKMDYREVIDGMLSRYFRMLKEEENNKNIEVIIYGVPAPHPLQVEKLNVNEQKEFKQLVSYFNERLSKLCDLNSLTFLDVYQLTDLNGESNLQFHTDDIHVKGEVLPEIFSLL